MTTKQIAKKEESLSTRFMNAVVSEFNGSVGEVALTDHQKRLVQGYFMAIDKALNGAEERRARASGKWRDAVPVTWANVNMESLAQSVVSAARIGLDPMLENHVNPIPFKNNKTNKYDIVLMEGYRGIEIKARKYGLDAPDTVIVELIYSTDVFKPIKKDRNNPYETYDFEITNPFERGEVVGGFYYHIYLDSPEKNKLKLFSLEDILKRKPKHGNVDFWGGEKAVWEKGQKVGVEQVDGWFDEMAWKTIHRAAHRDIAIDSQKIDDDYLRLKQVEETYIQSEVQAEIDANANQEILDIEVEDAEFEETNIPELLENDHEDNSQADVHPECLELTEADTSTEGPDF